MSCVVGQKKEQTSSSQWHSDQRETLCKFKKSMGDITQGHLTWMFALIEPAGESFLCPPTWDRSIYHGAVTVETIDGVLFGGRQADRGVCTCFISAAAGNSRNAQEVARLVHHHATLACESRGGGGGRGSRCRSREVGLTSNGTLSQIDMAI